MKKSSFKTPLAALWCAIISLSTLSSLSAWAEKPDFNGIWQTLGNLDWNIEPHPASAHPDTNAGAFAATQGGLGIVVGGKIPYQPWALQQRAKNFADRVELDPANKCYLPGVPRANYLPYPLQIVQTPKHIFIAYEFAQASRTLYIDQPNFEAPVDAWMGHSRAHWEGDTLIVKVTDQVADTWLDRAGNFHGTNFTVEERYTLEGPNHIRYEATLQDPDTYTKPFRISTLLYRNMEANAQLLDFKCIEFVEEKMYGHLSKKDKSPPQKDLPTKEAP